MNTLHITDVCMTFQTNIQAQQSDPTTSFTPHILNQRSNKTLTCREDRFWTFDSTFLTRNSRPEVRTTCIPWSRCSIYLGVSQYRDRINLGLLPAQTRATFFVSTNNVIVFFLSNSLCCSFTSSCRLQHAQRFTFTLGPNVTVSAVSRCFSSSFPSTPNN